MKNLTESKTVQLWLKKSCGSEQSRKAYLQKFNKFCEYYNLSPDTLVEQWRTVRYDWKERQQFLDTWIENIEHYIYNRIEGYASLTKQQTAYAIISFFQHNKIPIEDVDMPKNPHVQYHNRDIQKHEIKRILEHSKIRERAFYLMMVESGLRPDSILKLRYENIKEDFEANRIPMKIDVPQAIIKDKVGDRFTFIGEDGFNALKEYLSTRQPLENNTYLFERQKHRRYGRLTESAIANIFRETIMKLGLVDKGEYRKPKRIRLYSLRKYWYNNNRAEAIYKRFWAGWALGTQGHYITRDVEEHRKRYAKTYPSIRIYQPETNEQIQKLREHYDKKLEEKDRIIKQLMNKLGILEYMVKQELGENKYRKAEKKAKTLIEILPIEQDKSKSKSKEDSK